MRRTCAVITTVLTLVLLAACLSEPHEVRSDAYEPGEELSGGATTTTDLGENAFNHAAANLSDEENTQFVVGNSFFRQNWVTAPASTEGRDGLGPLFNAQSCSGCHLRDGRGRPPTTSEEVSGLLFRLSVAGTTATEAPRPHPLYGSQFQPHGIAGVADEGEVVITCTPIQGRYADGTPYELMQPTYTFRNNPYGPLDDVLVSPRVAQQICGTGLLQAIPEPEILANATITTDGISGRPNRVYDVALDRIVLGRFGWKANEPTVRQQIASAFNGDLGITSSLFPHDHCTPAQPACSGAINGNSDGEPFELPANTFDRVAFYAATLGVPVRRGAQDAHVLEGKRIFNAIGCAACHRPAYITGASDVSPALSHQTIRPYTDMLLHDMGPGLADGRPDALADGTEWRTAPLWGIGLFLTTNGHSRYLHDGRARDLNEAVLWHGGEAARAQERYRQLSAADRQALITFLNSL